MKMGWQWRSKSLSYGELMSNGTVMTREIIVYQPGIVPYQAAWDWQKQLQQSLIQTPLQNDRLLLLQHPPVYTLGQAASNEFIKFPEHHSYEIHRTERGGEVTYHCPGQLIGYPILNLAYYQQDLHWYLRQLEEVVIQLLAIYNLTAERIPGLTGVWLADQKIAAIGIKVSRWVTMHGFAINVCNDLSGFQQIVPCGIADRQVGSIQEYIPDIDLATVQQQIIAVFGEVFDRRMVLA
jgi:lipoyl(octanoyl) transferase